MESSPSSLPPASEPKPRKRTRKRRRQTWIIGFLVIFVGSIVRLLSLHMRLVGLNSMTAAVTDSPGLHKMNTTAYATIAVRSPRVDASERNNDTKQYRHSSNTQRRQQEASHHPLGMMPMNTGQYIKTNKRGKPVFRNIHNVTIKELNDLDATSIISRRQRQKIRSSQNSTSAANTANHYDDIINNQTREELIRGKEVVMQKLQEAGIRYVDDTVLALLPTWEDVTSLYGEKPIVVGLETCPNSAAFRQPSNQQQQFKERTSSVDPADQYVGTAGLYNTGTNALTYYLRANLYMPQNTKQHYRGILSAVPWHKHTFFRDRYSYTTKIHASIPKDHVFPIVMIRDPFTWAQSMCKAPYDVATIRHTTNSSSKTTTSTNNACPDFQSPVTISRRKEDSGGSNVSDTKVWKNILDLWNDYHQDYIYGTDHPRLIVRFEDLIWHAKDVVRTIRDCTNASWIDPQTFFYVVDASKWEHVKSLGPQSNLISAMIKHFHTVERIRDVSSDDLQSALLTLDQRLLNLFHYSIPSTTGDCCAALK